MSEAQSALQGASLTGIVKVQEMGVQGMITLRGSVRSPKLKEAVSSVTGVDLPGQRSILVSGDNAVAWMSPDEWLVMVPYDKAHETVSALRAALGDSHAMVENVSDARAMFRLTGDEARVREVLAKLSPADFETTGFAVGDMRRTRFAQVPAAVWLPEAGTAHIVCFRSVGQYMFDLLSAVAQRGSAVNYFEA